MPCLSSPVCPAFSCILCNLNEHSPLYTPTSSICTPTPFIPLLCPPTPYTSPPLYIHTPTTTLLCTLTPYNIPSPPSSLVVGEVQVPSMLVCGGPGKKGGEEGDERSLTAPALVHRHTPSESTQLALISSTHSNLQSPRWICSHGLRKREWGAHR